MSTPGGVQYTGDTKMHVGVIMSRLGDVQYTGGYHEYTRGCSEHPRDTISTWGDIMSTPGDFGTNDKKPLPTIEDFCSCTFCDYAGVYVDLCNIRQLVIISLSGRQSPDPITFLVSFLIKNL